MKDIKEALEEIGLSRNETIIYLMLLRSGTSKIGEIAEKTGIHRRTVYDSLERLVDKGFAGLVNKDNKKYFEAIKPYQIADIIEEEKEKIKKKSRVMGLIISDLMKLEKLSKEKSSVILYEGIKGIKAALEDILKIKEENLVIGAHKPTEPMKTYFERFHKKRIKLGIKDKIIFNLDDIDRAKRLSKMRFTEIRIMPKKYQSSTAINIFSERVAIITQTTPRAIIIRDREVADTFREQFKILWKTAHKI